VRDSIQVTVEVVPWLTDHFGHKGHGRLSIQKAVPQGSTILDLLRSLAQEHPAFERVTFNAREFNQVVSVLVNNTWLQPSHNMEHRLNEGDTITLIPAFTGGQKEATR
jgi:molybdopterin converting factor small subunit